MPGRAGRAGARPIGCAARPEAVTPGGVAVGWNRCLTGCDETPIFQAVAGEPLLTRDDLDELSDTAYEDADPAAVAAALAAAAGRGQLADPTDTGYAYQLAAEIYERTDHLERALALAERSLAAYRDRRERVPGSGRAFRAELLLRIGREAEAMAELEVLRPLMTTSALAASYVPEALAAGGRTDTALRWLTQALTELPDPDGDNPVVAQLVATRERLRESREDPADSAGFGPDIDPRSGDQDTESVVLLWPRDEYEQVDERWPEVLEATGADDWEDYRRRRQALITDWTAHQRGRLWQVTGSADGFAEFLAEQEVDLAGADLVLLAHRYGGYLSEQVDPEPLPPAPGAPCWCRSRAPYERCCLPLSPRR